MKHHTELVSLSLVGALLGFPAKGAAHDNTAGPMHPSVSAVERSTPEVATNELARQANPAAPSEVAIAYCHFGSIVDDSTGEIIDLFGLCTEELEEESLKLA